MTEPVSRRPAPAWDGAPIRPTLVEIDHTALAHNLRQLRAVAAPAGVLAVVKANAYGHGAVACSRTLVREGAQLLGVALVEEGLELRDAGIAAPILVLGGAYGDRYDLLLSHRLTPLVYRREHLEGLAAASRALGIPAAAHLDLDTGMGRTGIAPAELPAFLDAFAAHGVALEGLFTHFANSDAAAHPLNAQQKVRFADALAAVRARGLNPRYVHAGNSAGAIHFPEARGTLVRPGITLYGELPDPGMAGRLDLRPVLRFTTEITHLKDVPAGTPISYGSTWVAARPSRIATLPVGYADGYDRGLSSSAHVLVRGVRAPVAGRVCMDQFMVDVTDVPGVAMGDRVTLIGADGGDRITATELAGLCGTIAYELLVGIPARVPRRHLS